MTLHESEPPYPRDGRLIDETITGDQRRLRRSFLFRLGVDPASVPDGARIDYDPSTDEYRLEIINRAGGLIRVRRRLREYAVGGLIAEGARNAFELWPDLFDACRPLRTLAELQASREHHGAGLLAEPLIIDDLARDPVPPSRAVTVEWLDRLRAGRA